MKEIESVNKTFHKETFRPKLPQQLILPTVKVETVSANAFRYLLKCIQIGLCRIAPNWKLPE